VSVDPAQQPLHGGQEVRRVIAGHQVARPRDGDRGALGYHLPHPLHRRLRKDIALAAPDHQGGAGNPGHTLPQLLGSPGGGSVTGGTQELVVFPGPLTVGALADAVFQRA